MSCYCPLQLSQRIIVVQFRFLFLAGYNFLSLFQLQAIPDATLHNVQLKQCVTKYALSGGKRGIAWSTEILNSASSGCEVNRISGTMNFMQLALFSSSYCRNNCSYSALWFNPMLLVWLSAGFKHMDHPVDWSDVSVATIIRWTCVRTSTTIPGFCIKWETSATSSWPLCLQQGTQRFVKLLYLEFAPLRILYAAPAVIRSRTPFIPFWTVLLRIPCAARSLATPLYTATGPGLEELPGF